MQFQDIFDRYYTLYRGEATPPTSGDDEWTIGLRFANEALSRWANYDGMYWKELFTTAQTNSTGGIVTTTSGTSSYAAPAAMKEAGGYIKLINGSGQVQRHIPIINPEEAQFRTDTSVYAYFTGNPGQGFTLHLSPAPDTTGLSIDYVYYKKPTDYSVAASVSEVPNADFVVHRMLAQRYRASRNPYYSSAIRDSENLLGQMKMDNDSGNWANPWKIPDNSGSTWGEGSPGDWTW